SPANAGRLIENALRSHERAATLRPAPTAEAEAQRARGRRRLLQRLAYTRLSNLDRAGAREALRRAWATGAPKDARSLALFTAALLPGSALEGLHRLKRALA
ncbi:MAG TPA: hypothetical protein VFX50_06670, partial [Gemmatimonadales bacterium]|nr:hypothetical protein [Gemmatimonadales bacterium]